LGCFCCLCYRCCLCSKCCDRSDISYKQSKTKRNVLRLFFVLTWIPILTFCILGLAANRKVSSGVTMFGDQIETSMNDFVSTSTSLYLKITTLPDSQQKPIIESLSSLQNGVVQVKDKVSDVKTLVFKINKYREIVFILGFALPLLALVLAVIGYLCRCSPKNSNLLVYLVACLLSVVIWVSFAVHLPVTRAVNDVCKFADRSMDEFKNTFVGACLDSGSYGPSFWNASDFIKNDLSQLHDIVEPLGLNVTAVPPPVDVSIESSITFFVNFIKTQTYYVNSSLDSTSASPEQKVQIRQLLTYLNIYADIAEELGSLASCKRFKEFYLGVRNALCVTLLQGLRMICASAAVVGLLIFPASKIAVTIFRERISLKPEYEPLAQVYFVADDRPTSGSAYTTS